jgi:hypothetical protein
LQLAHHHAWVCVLRRSVINNVLRDEQRAETMEWRDGARTVPGVDLISARAQRACRAHLINSPKRGLTDYTARPDDILHLCRRRRRKFITALVEAAVLTFCRTHTAAIFVIKKCQSSVRRHLGHSGVRAQMSCRNEFEQNSFHQIILHRY